MRRVRQARPIFLLAAFCFLLFTGTVSGAERPDLTVVIVIDQFRHDYLERFRPYFAPDGFRRFLDRGATFTNAYYPYSATFTGPGHAAIGTGYPPSENGIVGNDWYDRATGRNVYCVGDTRVAGRFSPVHLQSDSLGDRVQEKFPGARVYAVALKDRAAILMAGRKATAAYWFEPKTGFTSSSYYRSNTALMTSYNATIAADVAAHPEWVQSSYIPASDLPKLTYDPESLRKHKSDRAGLGVSFPHPIKSLDALTYTPFGNGLEIRFAQRLIETERLGVAGGSPDILFIGLSSPDYYGHSFGPESLEVADGIVRMDRDLASLFAWLDARYAGRYTAALSADHGVQSIPEVARALGRDAGRVSLRNPSAAIKTIGDLAGYAPARAELERLVAAALDQRIADDTPIDQGFISLFEEPSVYLNWSRVAASGLDGERVKRAVRDAAMKLKGVSGAFTNSELMTTRSPQSPIERSVRLAFRADRSGDVLITLKPGYVWGFNPNGATHGQPVDDDQHVPLLLWGRGVTAKRYEMRVAPTDIAKSLGSLFGVDAGAADSLLLPCMAAADTEAVLKAALAKAPPFEHLVRGEKMPSTVIAGLDFVSVPESSTEVLPAGYARLDRVDVNGDTATVTIWYGAIPRPQPGVLTMNCGTGRTFQLQRDANGTWQVKSFGIATC